MQNKNESTGKNFMGEIYSGTVHIILKSYTAHCRNVSYIRSIQKLFAIKKCYSLFQLERTFLLHVQFIERQSRLDEKIFFTNVRLLPAGVFLLFMLLEKIASLKLKESAVSYSLLTITRQCLNSALTLVLSFITLFWRIQNFYVCTIN